MISEFSSVLWGTYFIFQKLLNCVSKVYAISSISKAWEFCCFQLWKLAFPLILAIWVGTWVLFQLSDDSGCWPSSHVFNYCLYSFMTRLSNLLTMFPLGNLSSYDWVIRVPYSFWTEVLCHLSVCIACVFSVSLACFFISLALSLKEKKLWILMKSGLVFILWSILLVS